ncbi:exodeoxyribonuclease-5 [Dysgonomonadaceae bacterium PH5-43]|nr:exodeoxyribonuclease-5 [Dysgonomonadaceae bacterium PH5-43]
MITELFLEQIKNNFVFSPTKDQELAMNEISKFMFSHNDKSIFLLKGYAGTGKSSLLGALVKTMNSLQQKTVLLAPTGRAAKVFALYAGQPAYTIHKKIYRQKAFSNDYVDFTTADNLNKNTLFIVDEASMIANSGIDSISFGNGRLLDDLIHYVYSGEGCRMVLLGDSAQLPPVSQTESPALDDNILSGYGLDVTSVTLTQVVRQAEMSGILMNATNLRKAIELDKVFTFPKITISNYKDVKIVRGEEMVEAIEDAYSRDGMEETIVISRSNYASNLFNKGIRNQILWREEELSSGEMLMVVKNNYHWTEKIPELDFIANGDIMEIKRVGKEQQLYGFNFCDVTAYFPDYNVEMDLKIIKETLHSNSPALSKEESDKLFYSVLEDYADIPTKKGKLQKIKADPFFNAVQVKYAYAVTGHKAQGGQWKNVFLDLSYIPEEYLGLNFYRWLYTAFTRATENLYLLNPVEEIIPNNS